MTINSLSKEQEMKTYTVQGRWPFPLDMLRYDQAEPASEDGRALIERLSAEFTDAQTIKAVFEVQLTSEDRYAPHHQRWEVVKLGDIGRVEKEAGPT